MRHGKKIHRLSRPAEHRKALLNNLALSLISNKQIRTTDTKAKALKPYIDRLISTALQNTLHAKRLVAKSLPNKAAFKELFDVIVPKLEGRTSGFSRIVKYGTRKGDGASISIIELLIEKEVEEKDKKDAKKKAKSKVASKKKETQKAAKEEKPSVREKVEEVTEAKADEKPEEVVEGKVEEKPEEMAEEPKAEGTESQKEE